MEDGEALEVPQWEHPGDYEVSKAAEASNQWDLHSGTGMLTATFDGGAA